MHCRQTTSNSSRRDNANLSAPVVRAPRSRRKAGFSLMEVMIALGIFLIALFTILGLVSQLLRNARAFQNKKAPDAEMAQGYFNSITNRVSPGLETYEFDDLADFNGLYRDYYVEKDTSSEPVLTNGLWQVDYRVINRRTHAVESAISTYYFDPNSQPSGVGLGMPR